MKEKLKNNANIKDDFSLFLENFKKIELITDEQLKIDLNSTKALTTDLIQAKNNLVTLNNLIKINNLDHFNIVNTDYINAKGRIEAFISEIERIQRINDYNKAFKDKINIFIKRKRTNLLLGLGFFTLTIIVIGLLIVLAICNFPFSSHAQKIVDMISALNNGGVKINHSLIYFLPKLLYVSCLLFLINICYNNYSFHKNLANLYRDKMDMANQLLALLEARQDPKERETILNKMLEILTKDREFGVKNYGTGLGISSSLPIILTTNTKQS